MFSREEQYLKEKVGKSNPFRVPEGYFDDFASRLMDSLPEQESTVADVRPLRRRHGLRVLLYAAACLCMAVFGAALYFGKVSVATHHGSGQAAVAQQSPAASSDSYVDAVADYAMMDNTDIYAYLSGE